MLDDAGAREMPDDLSELPDDAAPGEDADGVQALVVPDPLVVLDVPGLLAEHLRTAAPDTAVRDPLAAGHTIRRGQDYSVRVTAALSVHRAALDLCRELGAEGASPAGRKAYRVYADRLATTSTTA
ncbi:resolvase [Streptomyces sp. NPDC058861]|uniref:resolvase n=1 Tax=Streptomyces sp. NPDC058861 TaxID=3346653 RepID=UPI00369B515D